LERAAQISENAHPDDWPFIAAAIRAEIERLGLTVPVR
jgi:hypothetical protein